MDDGDAGDDEDLLLIAPHLVLVSPPFGNYKILGMDSPHQRLTSIYPNQSPKGGETNTRCW